MELEMSVFGKEVIHPFLQRIHTRHLERQSPIVRLKRTGAMHKKLTLRAVVNARPICSKRFVQKPCWDRVLPFPKCKDKVISRPKEMHDLEGPARTAQLAPLECCRQVRSHCQWSYFAVLPVGPSVPGAAGGLADSGSREHPGEWLETEEMALPDRAGLSLKVLLVSLSEQKPSARLARRQSAASDCSPRSAEEIAVGREAVGGLGAIRVRDG